MKRRNFIAGAGACALAGTLGTGLGATRVVAAAVAGPLPSSSPSSGLIMLERGTHAAGRTQGQFRLERFWPEQTAAANALATWTVDLLLQHDGHERRLQAWQLQRHCVGACVPAAGLQLSVPAGARLSLATRGRNLQGTSSTDWCGPVPGAGLMLLVSCSVRSGRPPRADELAYLQETQSLVRSDGMPRDFDAVLIRTS